MKITQKIKLSKFESTDPRLIPYLVKLDMLENGIPVNINPLNIRDQDISISSGALKLSIDSEFLTYEYIKV